MLFRKKIESACIYCVHSARLDENTVLCAKKGVQNIDSRCLRFRYDPYKRIPKRAKPLDFSKYNEEDFTL